MGSGSKFTVRDALVTTATARSSNCARSRENSDGNGLTVTKPSHPVMFATLLTVLAGFLDAAAFIELNHLYVSFMSGNSTHLGMALPTGSLPDILAITAVVIAFVGGASTGTWIADHTGQNMLKAVLCTEALLLLVATALALSHRSHASLVLTAFTMGMQNVLHQVIAGADVGKGFITGALFGLGQSIARLFRDEGAGKRARSNMLSWCAFVLGASVGTLALASFGLTICLTAATVLILAMFAALFAQRQ